MTPVEPALLTPKFDVHNAPLPRFRVPSEGAGADSTLMVRQLGRITNSYHRFEPVAQPTASLEARLFDALSTFKVYTSQVAMHLRDDWRGSLFPKLDGLLGSDDWMAEDLPPSLASFATLVRIILFLKPDVKPGLGATSDGNFISSWTQGSDRLTLECLPRDRVNWIVSLGRGADVESAAGRGTPVSRLPDVLSPYLPDRWFKRA